MKTTAVLLLSLFLAGLAQGGYIPPGPRYPCPPQHAILYPCRCEKGSDTGLSLHCPNTNLASLAVALSNIASLGPPLDRLTISHSRFCKYTNILYENFKTCITNTIKYTKSKNKFYEYINSDSISLKNPKCQ
jgi:hypothetical protein